MSCARRRRMEVSFGLGYKLGWGGIGGFSLWSLWRRGGDSSGSNTPPPPSLLPPCARPELGLTACEMRSAKLTVLLSFLFLRSVLPSCARLRPC